PPRRPLLTPRQSRRPVGMAADHRHRQPAQALAPRDGPRSGLTATALDRVPPPHASARRRAPTGCSGRRPFATTSMEGGSARLGARAVQLPLGSGGGSGSASATVVVTVSDLKPDVAGSFAGVGVSLMRTAEEVR